MTSKIKFTKMQGTGNDFVVINAMREKMPADMSSFARKVSDRKFGVGCDQLLIVDKSRAADFKMLIYNPDGSNVEMCGNGIRCFAKYVRREGLTEKTKLNVETLKRIVRPEIVGGNVKVDMDAPKFDTADWHYGATVKRRFDLDGRNFDINLVSMGNPHCVIFVPEITDDLVLNVGSKIENHKIFPNRINVEFVTVLNRRELQMRVWERGAGETLACGTGASAAGVAAVRNKFTEDNLTVHMKGGDLNIEWKGKNVFMTGPAEFVFEGEFPYP